MSAEVVEIRQEQPPLPVIQMGFFQEIRVKVLGKFLEAPSQY